MEFMAPSLGESFSNLWEMKHHYLVPMTAGTVPLRGNNILKRFDPDLGRTSAEDDIYPVHEASVTRHHMLKINGLSRREQTSLDELEMGLFAKS